MIDRDPLHHKGAVVSYSIALLFIAILLLSHIITTYKRAKSLERTIKNKAPMFKRKSRIQYYLTTITCGLSILSYLIICVCALMAETHFPYCFCDRLPLIIPQTYAMGKIINYYFFLARARAAQGMMNIFPQKIFGFKFPSKDNMFDIFFPVMLASTVLIYLFLFNAGDAVFELWDGVCVYEPVNLGCQYFMSDDFKLISYITPVVDVCLCILFSYLFYMPILKATNISFKDIIGKENEAVVDALDDIPTKEKFIYVLKVSLMLSLINIFSTTICFSILPHVPELWWLWSIDYIVNSICCFAMMGNNRRILLRLCDCKFDLCFGGQEKNFELDASPKQDSMNNSSANDTMQAIARVEMQKQDGILMSANDSDNQQD